MATFRGVCKDWRVHDRRRLRHDFAHPERNRAQELAERGRLLRTHNPRPDSPGPSCRQHIHIHRIQTPWSEGQHRGDAREHTTVISHNTRDCDGIQRISGQSDCNSRIQRNTSRRCRTYPRSYDKHGAKIGRYMVEMDSLGGRSCPCRVSRSLTYIYTPLCHRHISRDIRISRKKNEIGEHEITRKI